MRGQVLDLKSKERQEQCVSSTRNVGCLWFVPVVHIFTVQDLDSYLILLMSKSVLDVQFGSSCIYIVLLYF